MLQRTAPESFMQFDCWAMANELETAANILRLYLFCEKVMRARLL